MILHPAYTTTVITATYCVGPSYLFLENVDSVLILDNFTWKVIVTKPSNKGSIKPKISSF